VSLIVSFNEPTNTPQAKIAKRVKRAPHPGYNKEASRDQVAAYEGDILRTENGQCRSKCRGMIGRRTNRWEAASGRLVIPGIGLT
jgi:hypothetical protein